MLARRWRGKRHALFQQQIAAHKVVVLISLLLKLRAKTSVNSLHICRDQWAVDTFSGVTEQRWRLCDFVRGILRQHPLFRASYLEKEETLEDCLYLVHKLSATLILGKNCRTVALRTEKQQEGSDKKRRFGNILRKTVGTGHLFHNAWLLLLCIIFCAHCKQVNFYFLKKGANQRRGFVIPVYRSVFGAEGSDDDDDSMTQLCFQPCGQNTKQCQRLKWSFIAKLCSPFITRRN